MIQSTISCSLMTMSMYAAIMRFRMVWYRDDSALELRGLAVNTSRDRKQR